MVQMQGGARCEVRGVLGCTSQRRASAPTPQMGLFQQPAKGHGVAEPRERTAVGQGDAELASGNYPPEERGRLVVAPTGFEPVFPPRPRIRQLFRGVRGGEALEPLA